jgi:hypothetical protein
MMITFGSNYWSLYILTLYHMHKVVPGIILLLIITGGAFLLALYMKDTTGWLSVKMRKNPYGSAKDTLQRAR